MENHLLSSIGPQELLSYLLLEKHPLYRYVGTDGDIHVTCLGCDGFTERMILTLLSVGQMAGPRLHIHVIADRPEDALWESLDRTAPALRQYAGLGHGPAPDHTYVTFTYEQAEDLTCPKPHPQSRYVLICLGDDEANERAAAACAAALTEGLPGVVLYHQDRPAEDRLLKEGILLSPFCREPSTCGRPLRDLALRTLKLAHLYDRLGDPRISMADSAQRLKTDSYSQRSSCASALHLRYKLASLGIDPDGDVRSVVTAYREALASPKLGTLLELEHRRWMMYMIAGGYRAPSEDELKRYGFDMVDGRFNGAWKCTARKLHPCLVPSSTAGIAITDRDWDRFDTPEQIPVSDFDPLDQVSLRLRLLAKKKCQSSLRRRRAARLFDDMASALADAQNDLQDQNREADIQSHFAGARNLLSFVTESVCDAMAEMDLPVDMQTLSELERTFDALGINISGAVAQLRQELAIFTEYAARRDYKTPDATIIHGLLWILYSRDRLPLIKLRAATIADNIAGPVILASDTLHYFGSEPEPRWVEFLRGHGFCGEISFSSPSITDVSGAETALRALVDRYGGRCVIDITGADERTVIAACKLATADPAVALIRSTADGTIEEISGFPEAPAYTFNTAISAVEIYALHGARKLETDDDWYMSRTAGIVPALWQFYQEFRDQWTAITAFFSHRRCAGSGLWLGGILPDKDTIWRRYDRDTVAWSHWEKLGLSEVFEKLGQSGFLRDLAVECRAGKAIVSFCYPAACEDPKYDFVFKSFNTLFGIKIPAAFTPFTCEVKYVPDKGYEVDVRTECLVDMRSRKEDYSDQRLGGVEKRYSFRALEAPLKRMEELGLIAGLDLYFGEDGAATTVRYNYTDISVKECFLTAGNILELFVWDEARKTRAFDDCDSNFSFTWEEGIRNELDVVLTRGLGALVVSCKTARFNKEHLYEIKYLTERFSLNSKPVIVYSSNMAYEDGRLTTDLMPVKTRAKAMGVYLIDLNELEGSLGQKLVRIATGEDLP